MNSPVSLFDPRHRAQSLRAVLAVAGWLACAPAWSALADLSTVPLGTLNPEPPRVNLMFILDDSGSMDRDFLPENTDGGVVYTGLCFGNAALNKVFYNPSVTYELPPLADGSGKFPAPSFTKAPVNGFNTAAGSKDLSKTPVWSSAGSKNNQFYYTTGTVGNCKVADLPEAQRANYAIWYSFYRTRMLMMKSASARALAGIDASKYRVGFTVINYNGVDEGDNFHSVGDFDMPVSATNPKTNRTAVLEKLYKAAPTGWTPLRTALVKAGRYFGKGLTGQTDPIQYICQRNYALLTTDGYWNTSGEPKSGYKPLKVDGSEFGLADGDLNRGIPYQDEFPYTLADVAHYYYETDLRPDLANVTRTISYNPLKTEIVPQRMHTITLGLGLSGQLPFDPNYTDETLKSIAWPNPGTSPLLTGNSIVPRIDDLWHAAVNGRGRYYSAANPNEVVDSLKAALASANDSSGAAAAAAVSSVAPTPGEDQVFVPAYEYQVDANQVVTTPWQGDLRAYRLKFDSKGVPQLPDLAPDKAEWRAGPLLNSRTTARAIYFNKGGSFANFDYATINSAGLATHFDNRCADATPAANRFTQCSRVDKTKVTGENLIKYVRGEEKSLYLGSQNTVAANRVFRYRKSIMGDIVNSSPVFVGKPPFRYTDSGYSGFVDANLKRTPMVYVGANDGMLHAFNAGSGKEEWAFIPTKVIPNLWRLADETYDTNHLAFVDASPTLADVFKASEGGDSKPGSWHTVLVGGLGAGGRQFYAVDVTQPETPKLLWEYSVDNDANLGLSFGNPIVTKLKSGQWVAIFSSGYNNVSPGNGRGYLYVLDVLTGKPLSFSPIAAGNPASLTDTKFGNTTTPSNLGYINSWIHTDTDNTTRRIYGGDMLGNLWRFDMDDRIDPAGHEAIRLGVARDAQGKIQPITTRPVLTALGPRPVDDRTLVSFGTGKFLHGKDLEVYPATSPYANQQSIYAVEDDVIVNTKDNDASLRSFLTPRQTVTKDELDYKVSDGFFKDLGEARERVNVNGIQFNGLISFASNVPDSKDPCSSGGHSNLYYFTREGAFTALETLDALVVPNPYRFLGERDGADGGKIVWTDTKGLTHEKEVPAPAGAGEGKKLRRAAWRELID